MMPRLASVLLLSLIVITSAAAAQPYQPEPFCRYEQASEEYVGYAVSQSCQDGVCMMVQSWLRWEPSVIHVCAVEGEISRARLRLFKELPEDPDITVRLRGSEVAWPEREVVTVTSVFGESVDIAVDGTAALAAVDEDLGVAMVPITLEWTEAGEELTAEVWLAVHRGPCGLEFSGEWVSVEDGLVKIEAPPDSEATLTIRNDYPVTVRLNFWYPPGVDPREAAIPPGGSVTFTFHVPSGIAHSETVHYWPEGWCHTPSFSLAIGNLPPETTPPKTTSPPPTTEGPPLQLVGGSTTIEITSVEFVGDYLAIFVKNQGPQDLVNGVSPILWSVLIVSGSGETPVGVLSLTEEKADGNFEVGETLKFMVERPAGLHSGDFFTVKIYGPEGTRSEYIYIPPTQTTTPPPTEGFTTPPATLSESGGKTWIYLGIGAIIGGGIVALLMARKSEPKPKSSRRGRRRP